MGKQPKPKMMWIDLTVSIKQSELPKRFTDLFDIRRPHPGSSIESEIVRQQPDTLLFDFDYPERSGLKLLERTKQQFPSLAILMMTVQHSEALAVWAFRARAWDYLVKPMSDAELVRITNSVRDLMEKVKLRQNARLINCKASPLPAENRVSLATSTPAELMPALAYIEQNFKEKVTSSNVANACKMDTFRFSRMFKNAFGITFKEYLLRTRIREACRLLENPDLPVTEVAYLAGFNDPSYFSKVFKKYTGICPSEFTTAPERREILGDDRFSLLLEQK